MPFRLRYPKNNITMKTLQPLLALLFCTTLCFAQPQALPYTSGFDNTAQQTGWQEFRKGHLSNYSWDISGGNASSAPNQIFHDYPVGGSSTDTVVDWWVSPALISNNGAKLSFKYIVYSIIGTATAVDEFSVWYSNTSADPATGNYQKIADLTQEVTSDGTTWQDTANVLIPASGNIYIAFKYKATNNWFTISLDDIAVTPAFGVGVDDVQSQSVSMYPNPVNDIITVAAANTALIEIADISGRAVLTANSQNNTTQINVGDLPTGIYVVKLFNNEKQLIHTQKVNISR